jgi:ABC-2 type transport system ATP-binding protein
MSTAAPSAPTVQATGLWKRFTARAVVRDVTCAINPGEAVGLVGPNGSGKSTTIRMLLGMLTPDAGEARLFGQAPGQEGLRRTGYLPEERGLYRGMRAGETVRYLAELKGLSPADAAQAARTTLERLGFGAFFDRPLKTLSRGQAQMVGFAATVAHRPHLLVMDEPFSGLDPVHNRLMKEFLAQMRAEGTAILLSTHQMDDVEELCDRVLMLDQGELVLEGPVGAVRRRFGTGMLEVEGTPEPAAAPAGVVCMHREGAALRMQLAPGAAPESVLRALLDGGMQVSRFAVSVPSLEEVFVRTVQERRGGGAHA